jgi:hypothetical protein
MDRRHAHRIVVSVPEDSADSVDDLDIPAFLHRDAETLEERASKKENEFEANRPSARLTDWDGIVTALNAHFPSDRAAELDIHSFADLLVLGFEAQVIGRLIGLSDHETSEKAVVLAVLVVIAASAEGKRLGRKARRVIRRASRDAAPSRSLRESVADRLRCSGRRGMLSRLFGI